MGNKKHTPTIFKGRSCCRACLIILTDKNKDKPCSGESQIRPFNKTGVNHG